MGSLSPSERYYLHSTPRTASSALMRILNVKDQANVTTQDREGYFLLPLFMYVHDQLLSDKSPKEWPEEQLTKYKSLVKECFTSLKNYLDEASSHNHKVFIKEHADFLTDPTAMPDFLAGISSTDLMKETNSLIRESLPALTPGPQTYSPSNHTLFPDSYLATWKPTFLLRHPALMFPSQFRAFNDISFEREKPAFKDTHAWTITLTLHWARSLYELYANVILAGAPKAADGVTSWPIVLNSADVLSDPALLRKYCRLVGFEEDKLKLSWDLPTEEELAKKSAMSKRMGSTLNVTTGIQKEKVIGDVDVDAEVPKWIEEFGELDGRRMEKWVRDAMPDYEFLMERRLRV